MINPTVNQFIKRPDCLFINGEWVSATSGSQISVVAPATEEVRIVVAEANAADIDRAVAAARAAFDTGPWPRMSHKERAGYLLALADRVEGQAEALAHLLPHESGILKPLAAYQIKPVGEIYRYHAGLADSFAFEERHENPPAGGEYALIVNEPVGVVGAILPWNGPYHLAAAKLAPALIAGCTVVLKMAPEAPSSGYLLAQIAEEIGFPPGVINVVTAGREASERLVQHPDVDKITFTGSSATGKRIGAICGERVARCTLELGGKSAGIVLDDFDLDAAADAIGGQACRLAGQVCSALTRVIVTKSRHDRLVDALVANFDSVVLGDPFDPATTMGPLAMSRQREKVEAMVDRGVHEGATLARGGKRPAHLNRGFFYEPTVLANVDNSAFIAQEEIFGPVICVIPAENEEHAVALANDTVFGLNNSVFTNDPERALGIARQLRSGTVGYNSWRSDNGIGFGGFKQSGIGREGGENGLRAYLEPKTIIM